MRYKVVTALLLLLSVAMPAWAGGAMGEVLAAVDSKFYPSSLNINFLPNGTLIKGPTGPVYYVKNGTKSMVLGSILDRWFGENHYFKGDLVTSVSQADLDRYKTTTSVNILYRGKVLQQPGGTQYFIDDKLRRRLLSPAVRAALKFKPGNVYGTSAAHIAEFKDGGPITRTNVQPPGAVVYDGPWRGGRIWRISEDATGKPTKHLYLSDYLYEADYYPDEGQRVSASAEELGRYTRGNNISTYPDGWLVGKGAGIYVVQAGALRLIGSPAIFTAMGYKAKYVLTVYPELFINYALGQPIAAFKTLTSTSAIASAAPTAAATSFGTALTKVRPAIRALINEINNIALPVYDAQISPSVHSYWLDYLYGGEVNTKEGLVAAMKKHKSTGVFPPRTSRTATIGIDLIRSKWFPYMFYFVHQQEPSEDAKAYWYGRIQDGDRDTINKLGETLQWLKDTQGLTHK